MLRVALRTAIIKRPAELVRSFMEGRLQSRCDHPGRKHLRERIDVPAQCKRACSPFGLRRDRPRDPAHLVETLFELFQQVSNPSQRDTTAQNQGPLMLVKDGDRPT